MAAETRRARRVVLHGMYRIQPSGIPECSTRTCFHRQPPHLTARGGGGGVLIHAATSRPSIVQNATGTRYRGFPGHEGRQTRHFSAKSESFPLGRAQYQFVACGVDAVSVGHGVEHFALVGCVVPRRRRPDRRCPGRTNQSARSGWAALESGAGKLMVEHAQCQW